MVRREFLHIIIQILLIPILVLKGTCTCIYVSILIWKIEVQFSCHLSLRRAREIMLYTKRLKDPTKGNFRDWKTLFDFYGLMKLAPGTSAPCVEQFMPTVEMLGLGLGTFSQIYTIFINIFIMIN